jgi:hypothetical protein
MQPFIFSRGNANGTQLAMNTLICSYENSNQLRPATFVVQRKRVSDELNQFVKMFKSRVTCNSEVLRNRIMQNTKIVLNFIEFSNKIIIHKAEFRFMEDVNNELYFMGMEDAIEFYPKDSRSTIDFDNCFSASQIPKLPLMSKQKHHKTKACNYNQRVCYG